MPVISRDYIRWARNPTEIPVLPETSDNEDYVFAPGKQPFYKKYKDKGVKYKLTQSKQYGIQEDQNILYVGHSQENVADYVYPSVWYSNDPNIVIFKKDTKVRVYTKGVSPMSVETASKVSQKPKFITYTCGYHKDDIYILPNRGNLKGNITCDLDNCTYSILEKAIQHNLGVYAVGKCIHFDKVDFCRIFNNTVLPFGYVINECFYEYNTRREKEICKEMSYLLYNGTIQLPESLQHKYPEYNGQKVPLNKYVDFLSLLGLKNVYFALTNKDDLVVAGGDLDADHKLPLPKIKGSIRFTEKSEGVPIRLIAGVDPEVDKRYFYVYNFNYQNEFIPRASGNQEAFLLSEDYIWKGMLYPGLKTEYYPCYNGIIPKEIERIHSTDGIEFLKKSKETYNNEIFKQIEECRDTIPLHPDIAYASLKDILYAAKLNKEANTGENIKIDTDSIRRVLAKPHNIFFTMSGGIVNLLLYTTLEERQYMEYFQELLKSCKYQEDITKTRYVRNEDIKKSTFVYDNIERLHEAVLRGATRELLERILEDSKDKKLKTIIRRIKLRTSF